MNGQENGFEGGKNLQDAVTIASIAEILKTEVALAFGELVAESLLKLGARGTHYRASNTDNFRTQIFNPAQLSDFRAIQYSFGLYPLKTVGFALGCQ